MAKCECKPLLIDNINTAHRCMQCGLRLTDDPALTLVDWIASTKMQRRLSAGLWGSDHPSRMRFPTDDAKYEPASRPIIPMPPGYSTEK